jgi:hypothetical protein
MCLDPDIETTPGVACARLPHQCGRRPTARRQASLLCRRRTVRRVPCAVEHVAADKNQRRQVARLRQIEARDHLAAGEIHRGRGATRAMAAQLELLEQEPPYRIIRSRN